MVADPALYQRLHRQVGGFLRVYNRFVVEGVEHIPASGGAVICPRHENLSDPFFVGAALPRELHFLAWDGVERMPVIGRLIERLGIVHTIKTSLGVSIDKDRTKQTFAALKTIIEGGRLLAVFPEGNINHWIGKGGLKAYKLGAVRLAAETGVPIIPTAMTGTRWVVPSLFNLHDWGGPDLAVWVPIALPAKVRLRFGAPFVVDGAAATDKAVAVKETERLFQVTKDLISSMDGRP